MAQKNTTPSHPGSGDEDAFLEEKKKFRKLRRKAHNHLPEAGELNLTAMMDMLTIILVFLLKNYTTSPAANLTPGLNPPMSTSKLEMKEAITVAITRNDISVDDRKVVELAGGKVDTKYRSIANQPLLIGPLRDELLARVNYHKKIFEMGGPEFEGNMLIVGDRSIEYELLSQVLYTAGQAQLANFKFVVIAP